MRNPALHLVGIAASPGGEGLFGLRAEEELRQWLDTRLDALGIDPVAYSRCVLSLLRCPDSALAPPVAEITNAAKTWGKGRRTRNRSKLPSHGSKDQRRAVVQCLTNAADQSYGVESLVDELCLKLKDLESGDTRETNDNLVTATSDDKETNFENLSPRDRALKYYAAFPALGHIASNKKKLSTEKCIGDLNHNNKNITASDKNNNKFISKKSKGNNSRKTKSVGHNKFNKVYKKNTKNFLQPAESQIINENSFEFLTSMEKEREKQKAEEHELDQLRLAQLQAKFDESLEALWDSGSGISQGTDSIWAAPSLSIPSGPLWPTDSLESSYSLVNCEQLDKSEFPIYRDQENDESPLIPCNIDLFSIEDYVDEPEETGKSFECNLNIIESNIETSWYWDDFEKIRKLNYNSSDYKTVQSDKSPLADVKDNYLHERLINFSDADEDLLTSTRTHFRPIKDDGQWADGTTFSVNNSLDHIDYQRSESGNLLYLPGCESPYMEYRDSNSPSIESSSLTLKFRVKQCDKGVQTEPVYPSFPNHYLLDEDHLFYSSDTNNEIDEIEKDSFIMNQLSWDQAVMHFHNERKRRHSSSFKANPLTVLRPLTL